jgi:Bacterial regulatory proteins, tetR family
VPKSRRSQEERSQATRAALVNAAHRLFAEHGYAAVSADEIVAAAGVTRREVLRKGATSYLEVPLLAISFLHCKNVGVSDVVPPPKLARAQERRYGIPKVTYKSLDIRPMRRVLEEEGGMGRGRSSQQALHIVRGHFKTFDDHPLFGKHRGMFWWPMSARGSSDRGLTAKSYRVSVPPDAVPPGTGA